MKFVSILSAKGLVPTREVYTVNDKGEHGIASVEKIEETAKGKVITFLRPSYTGQPEQVTNITHVCLFKNRSEEDE